MWLCLKLDTDQSLNPCTYNSKGPFSILFRKIQIADSNLAFWEQECVTGPNWC